jgi:restriction endonuclease S subunit/predicted ATPase
MLPQGWVRTTLGEVCAINPGLPFNAPPDETEVSFVPMAAVEEESGRLNASQTRPLGSVRKGYTPFIENDVLFAKITPCMENGKIAQAIGLKNGLGYGSTEFFVFRPHEGLLPRFVLHFLLQPSLRKEAEGHMAGASGQKRVPISYLSSHEFFLPPTREQERIVTKLDQALTRLERAEVAARRAQQRLQRYRFAVLQAGTTGRLTAAWRDTHPEHNQQVVETGADIVQRFLATRRSRWEESELRHLARAGKKPKNEEWKTKYPAPAQPDTTDMPELPETWGWASLEMIAKIGSGISVSQNRRVEEPVQLPYLRVANVLRGYLDLRDIREIRVEESRVADYRLQVGDVLFTEGGDRDKLGRGWIWEGQIAECLHQNHVFRARPTDPSRVNSKFISHWGNTFGQQFFLKYGKQTTNLASINRAVLSRLPVPIPSAEEQKEILREIERRLAAAEKLNEVLEKQLYRAQITHESLLRDAFAGILVPQDSADEPATALLERIHRMENEPKARRKSIRREVEPTKQKRSDPMREHAPSPESLMLAWNRIGRKTNARRLFDEAGFDAEHVVQFYELLRSIPELRAAFQQAPPTGEPAQEAAWSTEDTDPLFTGRFRLVELWLENFKNLKDYSIRFDPAEGLDIVLGWNGTGKSNLFEAFVIIFRDLHTWWEKNRWPEKPMNGFRLAYEMDEHVVEVSWLPVQMKRPEIKRGPITGPATDKPQLEIIKREQLPLPRFVFGYYSGPTNRLAEHFLPMKQDHYDRLRLADSDDAQTLARLLEQRRFFCAENHHAKYVLLGFSYKEDPKISEFLEKRLRIVGFESALFIIRRPPWAKQGSKPDEFWSATGIMRRVMERLRRYAIAPMILKQKVSYGYRSQTEDHYYFFLPDLESLHSFAAEYQDARTFFLALESTDFSQLIHDVKIQVRVKSSNTEQVSITFHQLSEGEQQLLMVLGLLRFTKSNQSLVLLDEPDTHLNPHWSIDYVKDLGDVMSEGAAESKEQQTSQILMATHDPLVIASLIKEQIHLLKRDANTGICKWEPASVNPRGLGFTGILTSEMFGFRSDLDSPTLADLDDRVRLIAKEGTLSSEEKQELETLDKRLADAGFSKAFSDPYYAAFVRAWGRRYSDLMAGQQFVTVEKRHEIDRIAGEVLKEAVAEVEKEVGN